MNKSIVERFEQKYIPVPESGCWLWTEGLFKGGYGNIHTTGKSCTQAHRISWQIYKGPIPKGLHVLHKCDVPSCVNPDHLFLGTHLDNMKDKVKKGRQSRFNRNTHPMTKLTEEMCVEIYSKYTGRYGEIIALSKEYSVCRDTIRKAIYEIRRVEGLSWIEPEVDYNEDS